MVKVVELAIQKTSVDFGVTEGLRSLETQQQYVATGKSQTMSSLHLKQSDGFSHAVDLVAYVGGQVSWDVQHYCTIADAIKAAAKELGVKIKWGAAWSVADLSSYQGTAKQAMQSYIDLRKSQNRKPFIDAPHIELA